MENEYEHPTTVDELEVGKPFFCLMGVADGTVERLYTFNEDGVRYRFCRVQNHNGTISVYDLADFEE